jgi:hypothetical protein
LWEPGREIRKTLNCKVEGLVFNRRGAEAPQGLLNSVPVAPRRYAERRKRQNFLPGKDAEKAESAKEEIQKEFMVRKR